MALLLVKLYRWRSEMNCKARRWASSWKNIDLDHRNHLPEVDFGDFRYVFRMFTRGREHIDHVVAVFFKKTCSPWPTILSQTVIGCLGHPRFWARIDATFSNNPHDISYWGHRHAVLTIFVRPFACPYGLESTISGKIVDSSPESGGSGHLRDTFFFLSEWGLHL